MKFRPTKLTDDQDNEITNADKMANMFNDYFVSIGESLASRIPSSIFAKPHKVTQTVFHITPVTPNLLPPNFYIFLMGRQQA